MTAMVTGVVANDIVRETARDYPAHPGAQPLPTRYSH